MMAGICRVRCTPSTLNKRHVLFPYLAKAMKAINIGTLRAIKANPLDQNIDKHVRYL
jgi:hypothetical protein